MVNKLKEYFPFLSGIDLCLMLLFMIVGVWTIRQSDPTLYEILAGAGSIILSILYFLPFNTKKTSKSRNDLICGMFAMLAGVIVLVIFGSPETLTGFLCSTLGVGIIIAGALFVARADPKIKGGD